MSSRRSFAVFGIAVVLLAWACTGSDPALTPGAATDGGSESAAASDGDAAQPQASRDAGTSDASATCPTIPGNLLLNGSFEKTASDGTTILTWESSPTATLVQHIGEADDCQAWAELDSTSDEDYAMLRFSLPAEADAGPLYDIGASIRALDGQDTPVKIELRVPFGSYDDRTSQSIADTWSRVAGNDLRQTDNAQELAIVIHPQGARKLGIDRAYVIKK